MTKDEAQAIAEKIKNGAYFSEALEWYDAVYHAPIVAKAYSVVVTMVAAVTIWFAITGVSALFPLKQDVSFVMTVPDLDGQRTRMLPMAEGTAHTDQILLEFLLRDYVRWRETYEISSMGAAARRIRAQSSPEVYDSYRRWAHPSNPESPYVQYERHSIRNITIKRVRYNRDPEFDDPLLYPTEAYVDFVATVENAKTSREEALRATIHFSYTPTNVAQDVEKTEFTVTPMSFQVTSYEVGAMPSRNQD